MRKMTTKILLITLIGVVLIQMILIVKLNKSNENKGEKFEKSVFGKTINSVGDFDKNFDDIIMMIDLY